MAIGTDEKIILEVQLQADEAIKEIQTLKGRIETLKNSQKEIDKTTKEGAEAYEAQNAAIKALTSQQKALENQVKNTAASFQFAEGSLSANRAELNALKKQYADLSPELASNLLPKINELTTRIKEQEQGIQVYSRSVGDYENAIRRVLAEQKAQVQTEEQISATLSESVRILNSEEATLREVEIAFRELKAAQKDAAGGIKGDIDQTLLGLETRFLNLSGKQDEFGEKVKKGAAEINDAYADVAAGITAAFQLPEIVGFIEKGSAAAQTAEKIQTGFAASMQIRSIAIAFAEAKTVALDLAQKRQNATTAIAGVLNKATAATFKLFGASVESTSFSFKALRGAIVATGVGALGIALVALIQNFDSVKNAVYEFLGPLQTAADKARDFLNIISFGLIDDSATAKTKENADKAVESFKKLENVRKAGEDQIKREIDVLKAKGATDKQIFDAEKRLIAEKLKNISAEEKVLNAKKKANKLTDEEKDRLFELGETRKQIQTEGQILDLNFTKKSEENAKKRKEDAEKERKRLAEIAKEKERIQEDFLSKVAGLNSKAREIEISAIENERARDLASLQNKHLKEQAELKKNFAEAQKAAKAAGKETTEIEKTYLTAQANLKKGQAKEIQDFNKKTAEEDANLLFESYKKSLQIIEAGETLQTAEIIRSVNLEYETRKNSGQEVFKIEEELERRLLELKTKSLLERQALLTKQLKDETLTAEQRAELEKQLAETTIAIETQKLNKTKALNADEQKTIQATLDYRKQIANLSIDIAKATAQLLFSNAQNTRAYALFEVAADTAQALTNSLLNSTSPASADNVVTGGLASIPKYLTIASTILSSAAKVKQILEGEPPQPVISVASFSSGGYTGAGGRYQPAGIVHRDEYVVPSPVLNSTEGRSLVGRLESMRSGIGRTGISGFADGGFTSSATMDAAANTFQAAAIFSTTFEKAASKIRPVVSVKEINSVQTRVSVIEKRSRL